MNLHDIDLIQKQLADNYAKAQIAIDEQTRQIFDRTRDYNNTVVTIGYASFFAIWAFTKDELPKEISVHVALMMGISILLFVLFVIVDMLFLTYVTLQFANKMRYNFNFKTLEEAVKQSEEHKDRADSFQKEVRRAAIGVLVVWPFFFLPSLGFGLYAAVLLMYNFMASLAGWTFWPT